MPPTPSLPALHVLRRLAFPRPSSSFSQHHHHHISTPTLRHSFHTSPPHHTPPPPPPPTTKRNPRAPSPTASRGPPSTETTQTDFAAMDIFSSSSTPGPSVAIDACVPDGFHLSSGIKTETSEESRGKGLVLVGGEGFGWQPQPQDVAGGGGGLIDKRGMLNLPAESLGLLKTIYPLPDLLLIGTGARLHPLHPSTRAFLTQEVGVRIDVMDTANASAAYNLLATERGTGEGGVGCLLFCVGWTGRVK